MNRLLLLTLAVAALAASSEAKRVICYYGSWAVYRPDPSHFDASNIDPTLCTHVIYAYSKVSFEGEMQVYDDYNDVGDEWHEGQFKKLQELRALNPSTNTKYMIAVGGWNHGPENFQAVVVDATKRQRFVDTSVDFCRKYGFDGVDIDWEYHDNIGGTVEQKNGFSELLRLFRQRFDSENLLLSAETPANFNLMEVNYDWKVMSETLDFINLMAYDLHAPWENDAFKPMASEHLNVWVIANRNIELGADPAKINIGLPAYGYMYTLPNLTETGMYAPTSGPSKMGDDIPEGGSLSYAEICKNNWTEIWDEEHQVPYAVNGDQWVAYENKRSITSKITDLKTLGISGYMLWSVDTEDWTGACFGETFPLLRTIYNLA